MKLILETDRLLLREFTLEDLDLFYRLVSDPDVTRYTHDGAKSLEEVKRGLQERVLGDYRKHGYGRWATVFKENGQVIGFAGLKYLEDVAEIDLGYHFFEAFWGRGLATEVSVAVVRHGFEHLRLERVIGIAHVENKASIRVLEKVGFRFERFTTYQDQPVAWYGMERAACLLLSDPPGAS